MPWPTTSRHQRGYGAAWDRLRREILERDRHLCQPCRKRDVITTATQVDHVKPKAKGGTDDPANLQSICTPCHTAKTTRENGGKMHPAIDKNGWPLA